jgi:hypothetical protein
MAVENNGGVENPADGAGAGGGNPNPNPNDASGGGKQPVGDGSGEKSFSYKEDRSDWIPRHRLTETSGKVTAAERRAQELETALEQERQRVRALSGVEPKDPKDAEAEELREALYKLVPALKNLEGLTPDQLEEIREAASAARETSVSTWERHAETMVGDLEAELAEKLGVDKLTPTQSRRIRNAYREEAQEAYHARTVAAQRGERQTLKTLASDTDFLARHERGDKALLKEFSKAFLDDWYEPARRSATAAIERRNRPVPRGERTRTPVTSKMPEVDLSNDDAFRKAMRDARGQ